MQGAIWSSQTEMPSRDGRAPSFCSERMKICQRHLSKVYSRSKNLLVTARAGKVVPAVTGSAARGYADRWSNSKDDDDALSEFEKQRLSPFLSAVAGLFDGPSLLKQFQLKKVHNQLASRQFKLQSKPRCPHACNESIPLNAALPRMLSQNFRVSTPTAVPSLDGKSSTRAGENLTNWSDSARCTEATANVDCCFQESIQGHQSREIEVIVHKSSPKILSTRVQEKKPSIKQGDSDRQIHLGAISRTSALSTNNRINDMDRWNVPSYLSNVSAENRATSNVVVSQAVLPLQQLSISNPSQYKICEKSNKIQDQLLPGTGSDQQRALSSDMDSFLSQHIPNIPLYLQHTANVTPNHGSSPILPDFDTHYRTSSTMNSRNPSFGLAGPDSNTREVSIKRGSNPLQLRLGGEDVKPGTSFATSPPSSSNFDNLEHRAVSNTTQRSFSQSLPDAVFKQNVVTKQISSQPGTFASRLTKKVSNSGNVLQASVANFFGTSGGPAKPFHTLSVSQLHDAICDHSSPDCPSFNKKGQRHSQIDKPILIQSRRSTVDDKPPHMDALGTSYPQTLDEITPDQEIVGANETCSKYANDVRTEMRRQEKSSANLWKYGSMAVCTENPGRDYTTGESQPDAWEAESTSYKVTGINWSRSGSRKVVNHVCQILRQGKWGLGVIELLDAIKGNINSHCVNAILQQQRDPELCLAFFNWAQLRKGYKHDVFSFTTMINILGRARNLRGVRCLLENMHAGGIEPTIATYNTLILCYGKVESLTESLRVFRIMQEAGCMPDKVTYSILIHLCLKAGFLEDALKLYQSMLEAGVQPDTITYSIVIDSLGKSGNLREARKLFREMKERRCIPNEFTYNSIINRHAKARKTQQAWKYYTDMRSAGFKPNAVTCTTMMSVMGSLGKFEQAESLFFEMQQAGISADTAAYSLMINMWGNSGNLDKAVSWYGRMLGNLVTPSLSCFSSLVSAHLDANLYQAAQHFLTSMGMWGINPDLRLYTILLRHCTVCEKQEHADSVLGIMDRLGHPAHHFLYELLTSTNQDRQATRSRVETYFETVEQEDADNKQGFANALIDFLQKLQCKTDPGVVWEAAMEKGLFPSAILRREAPNHWLVDLHSMSIGTALVALPKLLIMLKDNWIQHPTKRVYVVTGWGKRSRVIGASAIKQAVNDMLDATRSPFSLDHTNAGVFVSYGRPFCDWISQPLVIKKLGVLATTSVVK